MFDWHVADDENAQLPDAPPPTEHPRRWWLITAVSLLCLLLAGWLFIRSRLNRAQEQLNQQIQTLLTLQTQAVQTGDGELFFSFLATDPAWQFAQLRPENLAFFRATPQVTRAEQHGEYIWANVTWTAENGTWQRIAFYQQIGGQLLYTPTAPDYWGQQHRTNQTWGIFEFYEADAAWAVDIVSFVDEAVAELCAVGCQNRPFTLTISHTFTETAESNHLILPSPRLVALTADGKPAILFWKQLHQSLVDHLAPAPIRFAVPAQTAHLLDYERAAADFMAAHPGMRVELVPVEAITPDLLLTVDAVAMPPTADFIAAGWVKDLTPFFATDNTFNSQVDFPPQILTGTHWQGRTWFMPQAAAMRLVFYDTSIYEQISLATPQLFTTWQDIERDTNILFTSTTASQEMEWGFLDISRDSLYAYAASQQTDNLFQPLSAASVIATLEWYQQTVGQLQPNLTVLSAAERETVLITWQSVDRRAILWVDEPVSYEHRLQLAPLGVAALPGADIRSTATPLTLHGSFISQFSKRPFSTWQWLVFLSYQPPSPRYRYIPARLSVAASTNYWDTLPPALRPPMQTAYRTARPIQIGEQAYFSWDVLTAVLSHTLTPQQATQQTTNYPWFRCPTCN